MSVARRGARLHAGSHSPGLTRPAPRSCRVCVETYDAKEYKAKLLVSARPKTLSPTPNRPLTRARRRARQEEAVAAEAEAAAANAKAASGEKVWINDGLGGRYDLEGYTGRATGDGLRIFKGLHAKNKGGGGTPLCPFDCECCV